MHKTLHCRCFQSLLFSPLYTQRISNSDN